MESQITSVRLPSQFPILVRKGVVTTRHVTRATLLHIAEVTHPFAEDDHLIVFGPYPDREAQAVVVRRLETYGLQVEDDFIYVTFPLPSWLLVTVSTGEPHGAESRPQHA